MLRTESAIELWYLNFFIALLVVVTYFLILCCLYQVLKYEVDKVKVTSHQIIYILVVFVLIW